METNVSDTPVLENTLSGAAGTIQLVSFELAKELYGVTITKVREIILISEITQVPQSPQYVKGIINLRNTVIPIIDLRIRFGLPESERTDESRIMVLQAKGKTVGIMVDAVSEVLRISQKQISAPPAAVTGSGTEYLAGLARIDQRLLILLDIDKVLQGEDAAMCEEACT